MEEARERLRGSKLFGGTRQPMTGRIISNSNKNGQGLRSAILADKRLLLFLVCSCTMTTRASKLRRQKRNILKNIEILIIILYIVIFILVSCKIDKYFLLLFRRNLGLREFMVVSIVRKKSKNKKKNKGFSDGFWHALLT